jgi:Methyltransferase domain
MNFKARWCAVILLTFAGAFICSQLHRLPCYQCITSINKNTTSLPAHSSASGGVAPDSILLDEWVRDCITWDKRRYVSNRTNVLFRNFIVNRTLGDGEGESDRRKTFETIFAKHDWPGDDPSYHGLKVSGPGAMLRRAQGAIATLHGVVNRLRTFLGTDYVSLLDIPCGDLQWMPSFLDSRPDVVYTGADIVPDIIENHRKKFSRLTNSSFLVLDVVSSPINSYDLVLIRDLLQHLWLADAMTALKQISNSGSRFLLATTYTGTSVNEDVDKKSLGGRESHYNLELPPFSLEAPICISYDWSIEKLGLWRLPLRQKAV